MFNPVFSCWQAVSLDVALALLFDPGVAKKGSVLMDSQNLNTVYSMRVDPS